MVDEYSNNRKKVPITEEDAATLLQRYSPETVLALLQEVSQNAEDKIDWNALIKNTTTGISSAREYQMLWRHLAYGHTLFDHVNGHESPLDDDSDLEVERESLPSVGREATVEAVAYVKVLMASGSTVDHEQPNSSYIEAPLTINVPNMKALSAPDSSHNATQGKNITVPVFVQKQPLSSSTTADKRSNNETSAVNAPKRKRKTWSAEEDMKLTAAVHKHGEQWSSIVSGNFQNVRRASELSQRWTNLKKKGNTNGASSSQQLSESQLAAAHRAMSLALDMPMGDNKSSSHLSSVGMRPLHLQTQRPSPTTLELHRPVTPVGPPKTLTPAARPAPTRPDSMIKAAAIAAGARIGTPSDSLTGAVRSQNFAHNIRTGGISPVIRPPIVSTQLPTNVHFIRDGLVNAPISSHSSPKPKVSQAPQGQGQGQGQCVKPVQGSKTAASKKPSMVAKPAVSASSVAPVKNSPPISTTSANGVKQRSAKSDKPADCAPVQCIGGVKAVTPLGNPVKKVETVQSKVG